MSRPRLPSSTAGVLVVDLLVALWALLWIVLGLMVAADVRELTELSTSLSTAGQAVDDSGRALGAIDIPLIGGALDASAQQIQDAGRSVIEGGQSSRETIERLSVLLGLGVAVLPLVPVLVYYLPPRLGRAVEIHSVKRVLADGSGDPLLERFLAHRAAHQLSYRELGRVSRTPWRDLEEGRYSELAAAELRRVGVAPDVLMASAGGSR
jgi:hypothetical protein